MLTETVSGERTAGSLLPLDTLGRQIKVRIEKGDKATSDADGHYMAAGLDLLEARQRVARTKGLTWPAFLIKHCQIGKSTANKYIALAEGRTSMPEIRQGYAAANAKRNTGHVHGQPAENLQQEQSDDEANDEIEIAAPEQIEDNILHAIGGVNENARVFNKLLKVSALDREAVIRINTAIDRMIGKWRSIQSMLGKKVASATKPAPSEPTEEDYDGSDSEQWERSLSNMAGDAISIRAFWNKTFGKEWENFEVPSTAVTLAKQAAKEWTELAADLTKKRKASLN
jgi:hypothetical protein